MDARHHMALLGRATKGEIRRHRAGSFRIIEEEESVVVRGR